MEDRQHRSKRLTPEQKWQVFLEASRKNTTDAEVCRRWGITPCSSGPSGTGCETGPRTPCPVARADPGGDPEITELEAEVERTSRALKELAIENTLLRGKVNGV